MPSEGAAAPPLSYDARLAAPARPPRALTAAETGLIRPGTQIRYDDRSGLPTFLSTRASDPVERSERGKRPFDPAAEALRHFSRLASLYGLEESDLAAVRAVHVHDTGRGGIIVRLRGEIDGLEVFGEEVSVLMSRDLERIAASGFLRGGVSGLPRVAAAPSVTAAGAVAAAFHDRSGGNAIRPEDFEMVAGPRGDGYQFFTQSGAGQRSSSPLLRSPARVKAVYFHDTTGYRRCWYVEVAAGDDNALVAYVISGDSGEVLLRNSLTRSDAFDYRVWAETGSERAPLDSPYGNDTTPHPSGVVYSGFTPAFVSPSLVTPIDGPVSTGDPWLAPGSTETSGNNVDAYADLSAPDGFSAGDLRATVTSAGVFDRTYDTGSEPGAGSDQIRAAVTQAFYSSNFLHDVFYDSGFDEASGNGQNDNFGRGGIEGDAMRVEAQDFAGIDNADMTTPADGGPPRMQLYRWSGPTTLAVIVNSQPGTPLLPSSITTVGTATFADQSFATTADLVTVDDGVAPAGDGCEAPFVNAAALVGKIAVIDRGDCLFSDKVEHAVDAGAVGVIIANNTGGTSVSGMSGTCTGPCGVGVLMVTQNQGADLEAAIGAGTVNVTMTRDSGISRDGSLDTSLVAHEWTHFLTNRLIGNGNGLVTNQSGGMGEGWSDFGALLSMVADGDDWSGVYPVSNYAAAALSSDATYFGIRRVPYSTDMSKDPLTFRHIEDGVPIAGAPCDFGCSGADNSEVHQTGEVWATMLWECYAALLADTLGGTPRMTFEEARRRMRDYLVASLKVTPLNPTFTEARDALLAVAGAADEVDASLFCTAFAKRGLGQGAVAPARSSSTNAGVVESFACTPAAVCQASPRGDCSSAPRGQLKFQGSSVDAARQSFTWKWSSGTALAEDFGSPVDGSTNYRLCVYDDGALEMSAAVAGGGTCGNHACWKSGTSGLAFRSSAGNAAGLTRVKLKPGSAKAQVQVGGKGASLVLPFPVADSAAVTVQLVKDDSSGSECWSSEFTTPALRLDNTSLRFQDKIP